MFFVFFFPEGVLIIGGVGGGGQLRSGILFSTHPRPAAGSSGTAQRGRGEARRGRRRGAMGLGVRAAPFTYVAHALAVAAATMVLVWCIHFRGGLAFEATNKNLIFNVST